MRHVSLHHTIDTPSHTPAHTRLLEHTPPYNRLWALAFSKGTDDQHFHFRLPSGGQHRHGEASPQAKQSPRTPPDFWWRLLDITRKYSLRDCDDWRLRDRIRIVQDEFDDDHNHHVEWHEQCTMGYRDGTTSRAETSVWYHHRIRWQAWRASSKRDHYWVGRFQRLDESPWCCQINYPSGHGAQDSSGIHGRRGREDALGKASISLQVKAEAQHLRD